MRFYERRQPAADLAEIAGPGRRVAPVQRRMILIEEIAMLAPPGILILPSFFSVSVL